MSQYSSVAELFNLGGGGLGAAGNGLGDRGAGTGDSNANGMLLVDFLNYGQPGSVPRNLGGGQSPEMAGPSLMDATPNGSSPSRATDQQRQFAFPMAPAARQMAGSGLAFGTPSATEVPPSDSNGQGAEPTDDSLGMKRNASVDIRGTSKRARRGDVGSGGDEAEDAASGPGSANSNGPSTSTRTPGNQKRAAKGSQKTRAGSAVNGSGSPPRPTASFYADFIEASNPPPPRSNTPPPKPKRTVALSKKALHIYQYREEANSDAVRRQTDFNVALVGQKREEIREVQSANEARHQVVQETKVTATVNSSARRGGAPGPTSQARGFDLIMPRQRKGWRKFSKDLFVYSEEQMKDVAERDEFLVPIRIDAEASGVRIKDTFTWNMNDPLVSPAAFAEVLCEDLQIGEGASLVPLIVKQICDQVEDFRKNAPIVIMEKAQITSGREPDNDPGEEAKDVADKWADNPGDLRIPIQLNVVVDNTHLHDQFEWDVSSWRSAPEAFADVLTREQGLSPEFRTAIAHQIREQVQHVSRSLMQSGYAYEGSAVEDEEISEILLPAVKSVPRGTRRDERARSSYGPTVIELQPAELERLDKESFRDTKRKKRGRARRIIPPTPAAPERETPLTMRTGVVQRVNAGPEVAARPSSGNRGSQSVPSGGGGSAGSRGRRAAAVAAANATAAMLAADRAADRAEREEDREVDEDEEDGDGDGDEYDNSDDDEDNPGARPRFTPRPALPPPRAPPGYSSLPGVRSAPVPSMRPGAGHPPVVPRPPPHQPHHGDHGPSGESLAEWELPHWLQIEMARVRQSFPTDVFTIAKRPRTPQDTYDTPGESFLRIRCHDCPGRQYALGPGLSLHNFEVHLNNRQHRANVNLRG